MLSFNIKSNRTFARGVQRQPNEDVVERPLVLIRAQPLEFNKNRVEIVLNDMKQERFKID